MPLTVTNLDEVDSTIVAEQIERLRTILTTAYPSADLRGSAVDTILMRLMGAAFGVVQTESQRIQDSGSLLAISEQPNLAEDAIADRVFSNLRLTRLPGEAATGEIGIVLSSNKTTIVASGSIFLVGDLLFVTTVAIVALPTTERTQNDNDRVLQARQDGRFVFSVPAQATSAGADYNIRKDTRMVPQVTTAYFVSAYAATDFVSGSTAETNEDVLTRLTDGIAATGWYDRYTVPATVRRIAAADSQVSVVGAGNPEMRRDQHWIWPSGGGGKLDVYVRTEALLRSIPLTKTAALVSKGVTGSTWQFSIGRDESPGFYEIVKILLPDDDQTQSGFEVTSEVRSLDLSGTAYVPDIDNISEGCYSAYQTAIVQFLDTETDVEELAVGDTADYSVVVSQQPSIAELQEHASSSATRNLNGDVLIRAAVPCFVSLSFEIAKSAGEADPDVDAIAADLAETVNNLNFTGSLYTSVISDVIHRYLPSQKMAVGRIEMRGRIRYPNGTTKHIRDTVQLRIPDDPDNMVSPATVAFFLVPEDVSIVVASRNFGVSN